MLNKIVFLGLVLATTSVSAQYTADQICDKIQMADGKTVIFIDGIDPLKKVPNVQHYLMFDPKSSKIKLLGDLFSDMQKVTTGEKANKPNYFEGHIGGNNEILFGIEKYDIGNLIAMFDGLANAQITVGGGVTTDKNGFFEEKKKSEFVYWGFSKLCTKKNGCREKNADEDLQTMVKGEWYYPNYGFEKAKAQNGIYGFRYPSTDNFPTINCVN